MDSQFGTSEAFKPYYDTVLEDLIGMLDGKGRTEFEKYSMTEFCTDVLGIEMTEQQFAIIDAVENHRRVAVKSCHSSGKTYAAAALVLAFLHTKRNSKVITTGPTDQHVREVLWQQIRQLHADARIPLYGPCMTAKLQVAPNWFALGFKPDERQGMGTRFQGFHAPHVLLVIDEAALVSSLTYDALSSLMTSETTRLLMIGNPTFIHGPFHEAFTTSSSRYHKITIRAEDTPNIKAGKVVVPGLIEQMWVDEVIEKYGIDSRYVQTRVYGEFPDREESGYISSADVEAAARVNLWPSVDDPIEAGLDVARFGSDENALCIRQGPRVWAFTAWRETDTIETAARASEEARNLLAWLKEQRPDLHIPKRLASIKVDVTGVGSGVVDLIEEQIYTEISPFARVVPVSFGGRANDNVKFYSIRDEMYWWLKERFEEKMICGNLDVVAMEQLMTVVGKFVSTHTHPKLESKDDYKRRIGGSPDRADAYALAFWNPGYLMAELVEITGPVKSSSMFDVEHFDTDDITESEWMFGV